MVNRIFVDTNILLRLTISQFPLHLEVKSFVTKLIENNSEMWINRQIVREYLNQVTRPQSFMNPLTIIQAEAQYRQIQSLFRIADETDIITERLIALLKEHPTGGKQIHDTNIVATMLTVGVKQLVTLNTSDFSRFGNKITMLSPI